MSGNRLSPQSSLETMKPTTTEASASTHRTIHGRSPTDGSLGLKSPASISSDSQLPLTAKTGQTGHHHDHSLSDTMNEDVASHRRYRSKRAHMDRFQLLVEGSRAKPNGVLAIHIKMGQIHDIDSEGEIFPEGAHLFVYLRILCVDYVKYSRVYVVHHTPATILFDELKHFYINVGSMKTDSFCFVRFEILAFDESKRSVHRVFASKEISLLQVVKCMYGTANLELWRDEKQVAEIEIEACFSTGAFGYGYSSLFDIPDLTPKKQLGWSMFCRMAPPVDRADVSGREVIACVETARPAILNFTRHAVLKSSVSHWKNTLETEPTSPLVGGLIGRRLAQSQVVFSLLRTRQERLKYLREFVIHPLSQTEETLISEDVHYFEQVNVRRTTVQADDARVRYSIFSAEPEHGTSPDVDVIHVIGPAMEKSPGVIRRRQGNDPIEDQEGRRSTEEKT